MIRKILVIDNDPFYLSLIEKISVKRVRINIFVVPEGAECMETAHHHQPHLIIFNLPPSDNISFMVFDCLRNATQSKILVLLNSKCGKKNFLDFKQRGADFILRRETIGDCFQGIIIRFLLNRN